jgi:hypothetical protein
MLHCLEWSRTACQWRSTLGVGDTLISIAHALLVKHISKAFRCHFERPIKLKVCAISCFHYLE